MRSFKKNVGGFLLQHLLAGSIIFLFFYLLYFSLLCMRASGTATPLYLAFIIHACMHAAMLTYFLFRS
jgi:hypothetical protein